MRSLNLARRKEAKGKPSSKPIRQACYTMSSQVQDRWFLGLLWTTSKITSETFRRVSQSKLSKMISNKSRMRDLIASATPLKSPKVAVLVLLAAYGRETYKLTVKTQSPSVHSTKNSTCLPQINNRNTLISTNSGRFNSDVEEDSKKKIPLKMKKRRKSMDRQSKWVIWCDKDNLQWVSSSRCTCKVYSNSSSKLSHSLKKRTQGWHQHQLQPQQLKQHPRLTLVKASRE